MEEELTTLMHMEFCQDENERLKLAAMSIDCEVFKHRKTSFEDALKKYSITEKQFWEKSTLTKVLAFPNTPLDELKKNYIMTDELYEKLKVCRTKYEICYTYEKYHEDNKEKMLKLWDKRYIERHGEEQWRKKYGK
ncbi:MAG: hypothetical protein LBJ72_07105 [Dysgonamonadaceae bacterium]|jgi:hypothetical protein|nr:hypothetical protein [Dysgonamonadaceae bacterium]